MVQHFEFDQVSSTCKCLEYANSCLRHLRACSEGKRGWYLHNAIYNRTNHVCTRGDGATQDIGALITVQEERRSTFDTTLNHITFR
jgi:hypothetical protein